MSVKKINNINGFIYYYCYYLFVLFSKNYSNIVSKKSIENLADFTTIIIIEHVK